MGHVVDCVLVGPRESDLLSCVQTWGSVTWGVSQNRRSQFHQHMDL